MDDNKEKTDEQLHRDEVTGIQVGVVSRASKITIGLGAYLSAYINIYIYIYMYIYILGILHCRY